MGYRPPDWAAAPQQSASLTVELNGKAETYDVGKKPWYVIGREQNNADIWVDESDVSRMHIALAHHKDGRLFVIDLHSQHGTTMDGAKLEAFKPTWIKRDAELVLGSTATCRVRVGPNGDSRRRTGDEGEQPSPKRPKMMRASHLLVKHRGSRRPSSWKEPQVTRTLEEAMSIIKGFRERLMGEQDLGKAFAELATKESHCGSAAKGGDLNWFRPGQMQRVFEDATLALDVGQLSSPVVSDSGVHLILRTG